MLRVFGRVLLSVLLVMLLAEALLQGGSCLVGDRASDRRPGARIRILSLGDSHTYGAAIPEEESYPAHLQSFLDEQAPGRFSVINLGLPGMSSTQIRNRLAANVARYEPNIVILWCGVNDNWNSSELDEAGSSWLERLDALGHHLRLYRLLRVWQHDRAIQHSVGALQADGIHQDVELEHWQMKGQGAGATMSFHHGERVETIRSYHDPEREGEDLTARTYGELKAMSAWLRAAGVSLVLVRYPLASMRLYKEPNEAMQRVALEDQLPLIDSRASIQRIPKEKREWVWATHPSGPLYREIARDIAPVVLELSEASH